MGIPIVNEIWSGIRWLIDFFINKTPRPIQILFFLLLLLFFGNMLSWVLHVGGVHCNSDLDPVKVDTLDIVTNLKIFWFIAGGTIDDPVESIDDVHPWTDIIYLQDTLESCTWFIKNTGSRWEICDNLTEAGCIYAYRDAGCYNCSTTNVGWIYAPNTALNFYRGGDVCTGDATRLDDQNFFTRNVLCEPLCDIPNYYAWDVSDGNYYCTELDYCGVNATKELEPRVDLELKNSGAELIYPTGHSFGIEDFLRIKCTTSYNPRLTLYGIDVFDYKVWVLIIVLYMMFIFLAKIKTH